MRLIDEGLMGILYSSWAAERQASIFDEPFSKDLLHGIYMTCQMHIDTWRHVYPHWWNTEPLEIYYGIPLLEVK